MALKHPWFVVKRYGYGVTPSGWGWLVTLAYVALLGLGVGEIRRFRPVPTILALLALTAVFVVITVKTSDHKPWRWRSGGDD